MFTPNASADVAERLGFNPDLLHSVRASDAGFTVVPVDVQRRPDANWNHNPNDMYGAGLGGWPDTAGRQRHLSPLSHVPRRRRRIHSQVRDIVVIGVFFAVGTVGGLTALEQLDRHHLQHTRPADAAVLHDTTTVTPEETMPETLPPWQQGNRWSQLWHWLTSWW